MLVQNYFYAGWMSLLSPSQRYHCGRIWLDSSHPWSEGWPHHGSSFTIDFFSNPVHWM